MTTLVSITCSVYNDQMFSMQHKHRLYQIVALTGDLELQQVSLQIVVDKEEK